jgi:NAD(P)-dependent dehydrogenase (short-subunit alcohol dehydrogenase family)
LSIPATAPASILQGRTIAITGAASGIGRALAQNLAARGARLALADRDEAGLAETARLLGNAHITTTAFDVTDTDALKAFIADAAADFGQLDGLINNAGLTIVAPFSDCPKEKFDLVMRVNFDAVVEGCRAAIPYLRTSDNAWLVNISSVFGLMAYPTQSAYNASKFAVRGLTEALYLELGATDPHIAVMRVHPGGIKTNVAKSAERIADMPGTDLSLDPAAEFEKAARTTPQAAAETIVRGMEKRQHRVLIGPDAKLIDWMTRVFPVSAARRLGALLGGGNRQK